MIIFNDFFVGLILSLLLGALIGTQREVRQQKEHKTDFGGFRTLTLISLLGYLIGFLAFDILNESSLILIGIFGVFLLCVVAYRAVNKLNVKIVSTTTEISAILSFIIGILVSLKLYHISITIAILITSILFLGNALHKFAKHITQKEIFATLKFAIISLVILPILPNKNYTLLDLPVLGYFFSQQNFIPHEILAQVDIFNFYYIWLMVVFISGISYVGYILMKTVGAEKGIVLTGFLGGLMSSTALTSSFAIESKKLNYLHKPLIVGTVIACSVMFFRIIFEVSVLNPSLLLGTGLILFLMGFSGILSAIYLFKKTKIDHVKKLSVESPFSIEPALKFAAFFMIIIFISKFFSVVYGEKGIYIISFLSGFADVDAITITLASLAATNSISNLTAQVGIIIAAFANTLFKGSIAYYLGSRDFFKGILMIFSIIVFVGIFGILFL